ncbi:MAG TPA: HTH domain-containing protein, partial [Solirubrobacteraceae bacterium]
MLETSSRLLGLLGLLQSRAHWTGAELAERLEVGPRTVRRDVDRLRRLGYEVDATPGVTGGYALRAGASLPPLLLDEEEAVAIAVGLRTATGGGVTGIGETSVRALAKLERLLPARVRRRVGAIAAATVPYPASGPAVDPELLLVLASACRDHEGLRFAYRTREDAESRRRVQPQGLVHTGRRWYLVAWDVDR